MQRMVVAFAWVGAIVIVLAADPAASQTSTRPAESTPTSQPPPWRRDAVALEIHTRPAGCRVQVNGYWLVDADHRPVLTPVTSLSVLPADYRVDVFKEGHAAVREWVRVGQESQSVSFTLKKAVTPQAMANPIVRPWYQVDSRWKVPACRTLAQRVAAMESLFAGSVQFKTLRPPSGLTEVVARFKFDSPADFDTFAVLMGDWRVERGRLLGSSALPPQALWVMPLLSARCLAEGRMRSTGVFELNLYDPLASRIAGTSAAARIHFGRMGRYADTDWMELSTGQRSIKTHYGFRLPPGPQEVSLHLLDGHVRGRVSIPSGAGRLEGAVRQTDLPARVHVGLAGSPANQLEIQVLDVEGLVDLYDETIDVLLGMGDGFWTTPRSTILYYSGNRCFDRLLLNGQTIAARMPGEALLWTDHPPLRRTVASLKAGDVLVFELINAQDDGALHVTGVDTLTQKIVLATGPLTWSAASSPPADTWFTSGASGGDSRPFVARGQAPAVLEQFQRTLGREYPGLPVTGPTFEGGRVWLKYVVR